MWFYLPVALALMIFGAGYLVGSWVSKRFISKQYHAVVGFVVGFGAIVLVIGLVWEGCSRMMP